MAKAKSFTDYVMEIRGGAADHDAGKAVREVIKAARESGKKGSVTFTLTFDPDKHDETAVAPLPSFSYKAPKRAYAPGYLFVNLATGEGTNDDPRQLELLAEKEAEKEAERERQRAAGIAHLDRVGRGNGTDG